MLNFGASKPRVKGGPRPPGPPGSAPETSGCPVVISLDFTQIGKQKLVAILINCVFAISQ